MPTLKLTYFDFTGRAEAIRKVFHLGGVAFTDERLPFAQFQQLKPSLPYGKVPVLQVDGEVHAETQGLLVYAARLAGLYPPPCTEPVAALLVDEALDAFEDFFDRIFAASFEEKDPAKIKILREQALAGPLPNALALIDRRLQQIASYAFFQENKTRLFVHEVLVWDYVVFLRSGQLDHIPTALVNDYEAMVAIHDKVVAYPAGQRQQLAVGSPPPLPSTLRLSYFDVEARAQPIRLAFHIGGVSFQDERLTREQFEARKSEFPFEQVPVLTLDESLVAAQSFALLRYVGRLTGLYPSDDLVLGMEIDEVIGHARELEAVLYSCFTENDPEKKKAQFASIVDKTVPEFLSSLDKRVASWDSKNVVNKPPFALAGKLTIADLVIYNMLHDLKTTFVDDVSAYTRLGQVYEAVATHPRVLDWHANMVA